LSQNFFNPRCRELFEFLREYDKPLADRVSFGGDLVERDDVPELLSELSRFSGKNYSGLLSALRCHPFTPIGKREAQAIKFQESVAEKLDGIITGFHRIWVVNEFWGWFSYFCLSHLGVSATLRSVHVNSKMCAWADDLNKEFLIKDWKYKALNADHIVFGPAAPVPIAKNRKGQLVPVESEADCVIVFDPGFESDIVKPVFAPDFPLTVVTVAKDQIELRQETDKSVQRLD
jgi:hypothetical protein